MTSICASNVSNSYQHFQLTNGNIMLLQPNHQQQQQQQHQGQQQHHHQLIAPKLMPLGNSQLQNIQQQSSQVGPILSKKAKYNNYTNAMPYGNGAGGEQMPSVARRNARERNRVKQVNNGFVNLRQHLPQSVINNLSNGGRGASKKLSKVDTLRIAVEYIRGLQDLLDDGSSPMAMLFNANSSSSVSSSADESSNDATSYQEYNSSMGSPPQATQFVHHQSHTTSYHSAGSPTSSSAYSECEHPSTYVKQEVKSFESFDSFSDEQPDDEELLDYISSWQEQ
ncbi:uncharacterized protein Dwil_GK25271 [Drosophila willistoni]|uniref:BHLH domain-containing protein n=1 Tax=Drosophila willistoni TaxID=7260 RepID=B4NEK2_DROWI|nr:achaete-scute complex protein T3 [Drosophila willistoni]EDW82171.1 uncharacterized protein Dwil_GK25271 [Drosophila willistoni]